MLDIVQLADIPLHFVQRPVGVAESLNALYEPQELYTSNRLALPLQQGLRVSERRIEGTLLANKKESAYQQYNRLKALLGLGIDIIGIRMIWGQSETDCLWLHGRGVIQSLTASPNRSGGLAVDISLKLDGYYQPINRLLWYWTNAELDPFTIEVLPTPPIIDRALAPYPSLATYYKSWGDTKWVKRVWDRPNFMLQPDNWYPIHTNLLSWTPATGESIDWNNNATSHEIWHDNSVWNTAPSIVHAFRYMTLFQSPMIRILEGYGAAERQVLIDLNIVDTILTDGGFGGLNFDHQLVLGDVTGRAYITDNVNSGVIAYVADAITYDGVYPAFLRTQPTRIIVDGDGAEWAALRTWRMLV